MLIEIKIVISYYLTHCQNYKSHKNKPNYKFLFYFQVIFILPQNFMLHHSKTSHIITIHTIMGLGQSWGKLI